MIEPWQLEPCQKCKELLKLGEANRQATHLRQVGEPIRYGKRLGTNMITTNYFYQCPGCGQLWQEIVDSGFGGHGRYLHEVKIIR